jgi:hypothetical protein
MMMTPEIRTRGAEGMKKIIEYTKKIGFYDGIYEKQMNKKTQKSLLQILSQKPTSSQTKNILS